MNKLTRVVESVYQPIAERFQGHINRTPSTGFITYSSVRQWTKFKPDTITPTAYAEGVVREVLKKNPSAWFWHGAQTSIVRYCDMFLPRTFWVSEHGVFLSLTLVTHARDRIGCFGGCSVSMSLQNRLSLYQCPRNPNQHSQGILKVEKKPNTIR